MIHVVLVYLLIILVMPVTPLLQQTLCRKSHYVKVT